MLEVQADKAAEAKQILGKTMIEAGKIYLKKVPIEVDVKIADDWSGYNRDDSEEFPGN